MESAVSLSRSNCLAAPVSAVPRYSAVVAIVAASALISPALANKITFETAPVGAFTGPVTEDGFTYSKLNGALLINPSLPGNPGKDAEGTISGGGVLKIVLAGGGNFDFNALDFSAFDFSGTGSQTLKVEGFLAGSSVGVDQYTLANTKVFNPKYDNWTTEAASVLVGESISELDVTLNANITGSGSLFNESIDNVVLTPAQAVVVPEPSSLTLLGIAVVAASSARLRRRRPSAA
jgi:PEP-CTERM motif